MHAFREMNACFSANQFKKVNLSSNGIVLHRDFDRNIIILAEYTRKTDQVNRWNTLTLKVERQTWENGSSWSQMKSLRKGVFVRLYSLKGFIQKYIANSITQKIIIQSNQHHHRNQVLICSHLICQDSGLLEPPCTADRMMHQEKFRGPSKSDLETVLNSYNQNPNFVACKTVLEASFTWTL